MKLSPSFDTWTTNFTSITSSPEHFNVAISKPAFDNWLGLISLISICEHYIKKIKHKNNTEKDIWHLPQ